MWKLTTCYDSNGDPLLTSRNEHTGRQVWVYDAAAGSSEERAIVEGLRDEFTKNRLQQRHSSDELLRLQKVVKEKVSSLHLQLAVERCKDEQVSLSCAQIVPPPTAPPQDGECPKDEHVRGHLESGIAFHSMLQMDDGHFPGDYGGPMFLMPGMLISCYVTGVLNTVMSPQHKTEMIRYLKNHQNEDGGFGLHIEGHSTMFGTGLSYVALRILGIPVDDQCTERARSWILSRGGITYIPSWGKFWLAVLGCFSWDGMNPIPPEMWLLPYSSWTGIGWLHPGRYWCHCRMVYLPMSYVYGKRGTGTFTPLVASLREELFCQDYSTIDWNASRTQCAKEDLYYPQGPLQQLLWWSLYKCENVLLSPVGSWLRDMGLAETMKLMKYEDESTNYIDIGPVNKVINMLCCWLDDPEGEPFRRHVARLHDYLWVAEDGMKMSGYNGSQLWDTAFTVQAYIAADLDTTPCIESLKKAHMYIRNTQVIQEQPLPLERYYRHRSVGAWPFSTRDHGWPISDCTAEGLKASLSLANMSSYQVGGTMPDQHFYNAADMLLSYQNSNGGWPTYELQRSFAQVEILNPAETFGDIMVDYSYVECSSACITALSAFRKRHPEYRTHDILIALGRGKEYIESIQRDDGSWYGSWGVCFTYGCWFGAKALRALGETVDTSVYQQKVAAFLQSKQRADGGWGETYLSCQDKEYDQISGDSHVVNTAWAMIALIATNAHKKDPVPLQRGAAFLMRMQQENGDWPQQHISGVFNRNCMITYANYRNLFPIWALGAFRRCVLGDETFEDITYK